MSTLECYVWSIYYYAFRKTIMNVCFPLRKRLLIESVPQFAGMLCAFGYPHIEFAITKLLDTISFRNSIYMEGACIEG